MIAVDLVGTVESALRLKKGHQVPNVGGVLAAAAGSQVARRQEDLPILNQGIPQRVSVG